MLRNRVLILGVFVLLGLGYFESMPGLQIRSGVFFNHPFKGRSPGCSRGAWGTCVAVQY
jgi:hypothetical protein